MLWIKIEVFDFSIQLIFKFKQYKNANIAKPVYYGKTPNIWHLKLQALCYHRLPYSESAIQQDVYLWKKREIIALNCVGWVGLW